MKTRVTITLDPETHALAKRAARARRTTVSAMIEEFLRSHEGAGEGGSRVDRMLGAGKLRPHRRGRDPLQDALYDRFIARKR
jgi:hypothetical protein